MSATSPQARCASAAAAPVGGEATAVTAGSVDPVRPPFTGVLRGYAPREVDVRVDELTEVLRRARETVDTVRARAARLEADLADARQRLTSRTSRLRVRRTQRASAPPTRTRRTRSD